MLRVLEHRIICHIQRRRSHCAPLLVGRVEPPPYYVVADLAAGARVCLLHLPYALLCRLVHERQIVLAALRLAIPALETKVQRGGVGQDVTVNS